MSRKATISLVSYNPVAVDDLERLEKTLEKMTAHVAEAASLKADLVVFPEICAYLNGPNAWAFEALDGPTLRAMAQAARANEIYMNPQRPTIEPREIE